jgi:hypothetical protein
MNLNDHRGDYAAYCSGIEREKFRRHTGQSRELDLRPLEERYSDLWAPERIADLRRALEETPADFETERDGLRALLGAALLKRAEAAAREVTDELARCEGAARIEWGGLALGARDAADLLAEESDAARRAELAGRLLDALGPCEDLRAARLAELSAAARALGFDDRRSLYERFNGADLTGLERHARRFLERTERAYASHFASWVAREGQAFSPRAADAFRFLRAPRLDAYFSADTFKAIYTGTLADLGIRTESQRNLHVDFEPRPGKQARSACFALAPPEDVRLVLGSRATGADFYRRSLFETGRAQMFAWASAETARRRPEFIYSPDCSTEQGHGFLLSGLVLEDGWLGAFAGARPHELRGAAAQLALIELHDARRDAAVLGHALALDGAADPRADSLAEAYAETLSSATGFRHEAASRLLDADEWFHSATRLRARLFAVGWREYLRSRYGRRWFAARAAGDELIDVWNTANRYGAEELARLLWGGELSFDLLADSLTGALGDGHE